jgi:hypothetical protein
MKRQFSTTANTSLDRFIYGNALEPVALKNGMVIAAEHSTEVNFTLPRC